MFRKIDRNRILAVFLLSIFLLTVAPPFLSNQIAAAQSGSCPSNLTLRLGLYGGAPNTFNMLSALPVAGVVSSLEQYYQMYPPPSITGQLDYNESVIDWFSHNSNYTQWDFNVKPNLKWSNGQPVTAQDILNTYSSGFALNPSVDFVNAAAEIKSESAFNTSEAVFVLNKSDAVFPERVGSSLFTPIMPSSFVNQGANFNGFGTNDVVVGAFYASGYSAGSTQGVFLRNPYFEPLPRACELLMQYFETDSQIATYIASGAIDFGPVSPASAASLVGVPNVHLIDQKSLIPEMLAYNVSDYPYNMTAFRQALVYATNESQIVQQADQGYGTVAYSSEGGIPQAATMWYDSNQPTYSYNTTKALSLLSSIGITKGSDGYLQYPNKTDVTLTIWYDNSFSENSVAINIVQSEWQALGFKSVTPIAASLGTLISDSYGNVNGINNAMIYFKSYGAIYGYAWTAGLESYSIDIPFNAPPTWEGPPGSVAQTDYVGNITALASTDNVTLEHQYLDNIQSLNAANIPVLTFGYGDAVWAYNTEHWTNWPSSLVILPNTLNNTALALLSPTNSTASASASQSTTTTGAASSNSTTLIVAGVIIAIVVIAGIAFVVMRPRRRP